MDKGVFIISLDFEMMWGVKDITTPSLYGESHIKNVYQVIPALLSLFERYDVKATFATVGLIMLEGKEEAVKNVPPLIPTYKNEKLSPYAENYIEKIEDKNNDLYFAPSLVERLKACKNVEIGTHTFCHYNCYAEGQTIGQFEEDIKKAIQVAFSKEIEIKSIVFPRNQVTDEYLKICTKHGIKAYRGNPSSFFSRTYSPLARFKNRFLRLMDTYLNIGDRTSYSLDEAISFGMPFNIKASRFFRPYNKRLSFLEPLRLRRIRQEIIYAARHHEAYHLWWHPHNFGANTEKNLKNLEEVLKCYKECHERYGMSSYTMGELSKIINTSHGTEA
ncbi:MAG: polysaccharide deacetylase family protein [Bacteroidaceae bacterium]|nr:polysaccharide deacetylase family protein [Bacteroidaceae bacterium]